MSTAGSASRGLETILTKARADDAPPEIQAMLPEIETMIGSRLTDGSLPAQEAQQEQAPQQDAAAW